MYHVRATFYLRHRALIPAICRFMIVISPELVTCASNLTLPYPAGSFMRTPVSSCIDFGPTRYDLIRENNLELVEI